MLETFTSPLQVEYFRYCTGVQYQPWFHLELRCFMCHTGVLECVTPTQDKFTPEKNILSTQNH